MPEWLAEARARGAGPALELQRNGRVLARVAAPEAGDTLRIPVAPSQRGAAEALYSVHDAATRVVLAARTAPALWHARAVVGAVENRPRPEIRGWVLDSRPDPQQRRRVAIELDGRLADVIVASDRPGRTSPAGRAPTGATASSGPSPRPWPTGTRVHVFDADTGRPLSGSPVRIDDGKVAVAGTGGR